MISQNLSSAAAVVIGALRVNVYVESGELLQQRLLYIKGHEV